MFFLIYNPLNYTDKHKKIHLVNKAFLWNKTSVVEQSVVGTAAQAVAQTPKRKRVHISQLKQTNKTSIPDNLFPISQLNSENENKSITENSNENNEAINTLEENKEEEDEHDHDKTILKYFNMVSSGHIEVPQSVEEVFTISKTSIFEVPFEVELPVKDKDPKDKQILVINGFAKYKSNAQSTIYFIRNFNVFFTSSPSAPPNSMIISKFELEYSNIHPIRQKVYSTESSSFTYITNQIEQILISVAELSISLSTLDLVQLTLVSSRITSMMSNLNFDKGSTAPSTKIKLIPPIAYKISTQKIEFIINHFSIKDHIVPLLRTGLQPLNFSVNTTAGQSSQILLSLEPLEILSSKTGMWDALFEPAQISLSFAFGDTLTKFSVVTKSNITFNFSFQSIQSILDFISDYSKRVETEDIQPISAAPTTIINESGCNMAFIINDRKINVSDSKQKGEIFQSPQIPSMSSVKSFIHMKSKTKIQVIGTPNPKLSQDPKLAFTLSPSEMQFPTFFNNQIVAKLQKTPFGDKLVVSSLVYFNNTLSKPMYLFRMIKSGISKEFVEIMTIFEGNRVAIPYTENLNSQYALVFSKDDINNKTPKTFNIIELKTAPIVYDAFSDNRLIFLNSSFDQQNSIITVQIQGNLKFTNLLPKKIYLMINNIPDIFEAEENQSIMIGYQVTTFKSLNIACSVDDKEGIEDIQKVKVETGNDDKTMLKAKFKETTAILACKSNPTNVKGVYDFSIFAPAVIFNQTNTDLVFMEKDCQFIDGMALYGNEDYFQKGSAQNKLPLHIVGTSNERFIECSLPSSDGTLFLDNETENKKFNKSFEVEDTSNVQKVYFPIHYAVRQLSNSSIVTITPQLFINNELDEQIFLQPLLEMEKSQAAYGLSSYEAHTVTPVMSSLETMMFGFFTSEPGTFVPLILSSPIRTVFAYITFEGKVKMIEMDIQGRGIDMYISFRKPSNDVLMLSNTLDVPIFYKQVEGTTRIAVLPFSSKIIAFERPFSNTDLEISYSKPKHIIPDKSKSRSSKENIEEQSNDQAEKSEEKTKEKSHRKNKSKVSLEEKDKDNDEEKSSNKDKSKKSSKSKSKSKETSEEITTDMNDVNAFEFMSGNLMKGISKLMIESSQNESKQEAEEGRISLNSTRGSSSEQLLAKSLVTISDNQVTVTDPKKRKKLLRKMETSEYVSKGYISEKTFEIVNTTTINLVDVHIPQVINQKRKIYAEIRIMNGGTKVIYVTKGTTPSSITNNLKVTSLIHTIQFSLIDNDLREIALIQLNRLYAAYKKLQKETIIETKLDSIQIDDQNPVAQLKTAIYGEGPEIFSISASLPRHTPLFTAFNNISLSIRPIITFIDVKFMIDLYYTFQKMQTESKMQPLKPEMHTFNANTAPISVRNLDCSEIKVIINVRTLTGRPSKFKEPALLKFIPNITQGEIGIPSLSFRDALMSAQYVQEEIISKVFKTLQGQIWHLLLGLDILINPSSISSNFARQMDSGGINVFTTVPSVVLRTGESVLSGASRIMHFISFSDGKTSAVTTLNATPIQTTKSGLKALGQGFKDGITGVVMDPIKGAKENGALGVIKGIGTGLVGLVTRPVRGVVDATVGVIAGVRKGLENDTKIVNDLRLPKAFISMRIVPFDPIWAVIQIALQQESEAKKTYEEYIEFGFRVDNIFYCITSRFLFIIKTKILKDNEKKKTIQNQLTNLSIEDVSLYKLSNIMIAANQNVLTISGKKFSSTITILLDDPQVGKMAESFVSSRHLFAYLSN